MTTPYRIPPERPKLDIGHIFCGAVIAFCGITILVLWGDLFPDPPLSALRYPIGIIVLVIGVAIALTVDETDMNMYYLSRNGTCKLTDGIPCKEAGCKRCIFAQTYLESEFAKERSKD